MANNPIGGTFENDFEAGIQSAPNNSPQAQNSLGNGFLPLDQALNLSPAPQGIEQLNQNYGYNPVETGNIKPPESITLGTDNKKEFIFNDPVNDKIKELLSNILEAGENPTILDEAQTEAATPKKETASDNILNTKFKNAAETSFKETLTTSVAVVKEVYNATKEVFSSIASLFKDYIAFKVETKEQKAAREKSETKKTERAMTIKAFYSELKNILNNYLIKKQKDTAEDQERLGISGMGVVDRNKAMGSTRNVSNTNINTVYHNNETYIGMVAAREAQKKQEVKAKDQSQGIDRSQIKYAGEMSGSQHVLNTAG